MLVPSADVIVDMLESNMSTTPIRTDSLGPCLCFLLNFNSFPINETGQSSTQILTDILNYLSDKLKLCLNIHCH